MLENSGMTPFLPGESVAHSTFELTPKLSGKSTSLLCCCLHTCAAELAWVYHFAAHSQCKMRDSAFASLPVPALKPTDTCEMNARRVSVRACVSFLHIKKGEVVSKSLLLCPGSAVCQDRWSFDTSFYDWWVWNQSQPCTSVLYCSSLCHSSAKCFEPLII